MRSFMVLPETGKSSSVFVSCVRAKLRESSLYLALTSDPCPALALAPPAARARGPVVSRWCLAGVLVPSKLMSFLSDQPANCALTPRILRSEPECNLHFVYVVDGLSATCKHGLAQKQY